MSIRLRPFLVLFTIILSLIIFAGCDDDNNPTDPSNGKPVIVSFTASPSTVPAGGDSVVLSWKVTGATNLSISEGIGSVTPVDSGSKKVFVASAVTFTLTATNASGNTTATAGITAGQTLTVHGFVKDVDGEPISGVTVIIKGKTPFVTTADGGFNISDVTAPYDIGVILSTSKISLFYQGLTRSDPNLLYPISITPLKSAVISGTVPIAATKTTRVFFMSGNKVWSTTANQITGAYTINADWKGSTTSFTGELKVLRWTSNVSGLPEEYDAYGSMDLTISNGGNFSGKNFIETDFTNPDDPSISGSINRPTGFLIKQKLLYLNFGNLSIPIAGEVAGDLTQNFSYKVPTLPGATFEITALAEITASPTERTALYHKKGIAAGSVGVALTIANTPQLNLPAHNGTGVDTTTQFLWAQGSGTGVNLVVITPVAPATGPVMYLFTSGNSTTIPNLNPQGLGLPSGTQYQWLVTEYLPLSSVDLAASDLFYSLLTGNAGEFGIGTSQIFKFTTHL